LLIIVIILITGRSIQRKKEQEALEEKNKEIVGQKKDITDSIEYAKRIQKAILASHKEIQKMCSDFFVLFEPKDIVSGDLYRAKRVNDRDILAAIDCT